MVGVEARELVRGQINKGIRGGGEKGLLDVLTLGRKSTEPTYPGCLLRASVVPCCPSTSGSPPAHIVPAWWQASSAFCFHLCLQPDVFRPVLFM